MYSDENLAILYKEFGAKRRERSQSAEQNVDLHLLRVKEKNLKKQLEKESQKAEEEATGRLSDEEYFAQLAERLKKSEDERDEARKIAKELALKASIHPEDAELQASAEKANNLQIELSRKCNTLRMYLKQRRRTDGKRGRKSKIEAKIDKVQQEAISLIEKILDSALESNRGLDKLKEELNSRRNKVTNEIGGDYYTFSFELYTMSEKVANAFALTMAKTFNSMEDGGKGYANADAAPSASRRRI